MIYYSVDNPIIIVSPSILFQTECDILSFHYSSATASTTFNLAALPDGINPANNAIIKVIIIAIITLLALNPILNELSANTHLFPINIPIPAISEPNAPPDKPNISD